MLSCHRALQKGPTRTGGLSWYHTLTWDINLRKVSLMTLACQLLAAYDARSLSLLYRLPPMLICSAALCSHSLIRFDLLHFELPNAELLGCQKLNQLCSAHHQCSLISFPNPAFLCWFFYFTVDSMQIWHIHTTGDIKCSLSYLFDLLQDITMPLKQTGTLSERSDTTIVTTFSRISSSLA